MCFITLYIINPYNTIPSFVCILYYMHYLGMHLGLALA